MADTQVQTPVMTPTEPKKVIKRKTVKVKKSDQPEVVVEVTTPVTETTSVTSEDEKDLISIIPSSRIKNYINKEKLNKDLDSVIESIKTTKGLDLSTVLSADVQKKIGALIKEKESSGVNPSEININDIAIDVLSKQRFKFSNNSFKVLSVFSDMLIEEITKYSMDELLKSKKSIINIPYVFSSKIAEGPLYEIYSQLPTFIAMQNELNSTTEVTETTETTDEVTEPVDEDTKEKTINFSFYIRKICNKLKLSSDTYSKIKVSNKYQKFCSNLILDFLNKIAPLSKILLEVMTTKTITTLVFETIIKIQLFENAHYETIMTEVHSRLSKKKTLKC